MSWERGRRGGGRARRWIGFALLALVLPAASPPTLPAQAPHAPGSLPSPEEYLGYPLGARFTPSARVQEYARAVATLSPAVEYLEYGHTPEGRTLFQLVVTGPANRAGLEPILAAHASLADPGTSEARAREIARTYPAVVYFTYGIHGNEASSSEAAMWTLWELVRPDSEHSGLLDSLVVVMDPVANPDGRDRYVHWYQSVAGERPNPDPQAREHREPWPGGRFNHYLFDLNRDWAWATQPETRARLATWWRWNPLVHVDFHEMSFSSSYFFFPAADPINPIYPDQVLRWAEHFGTANARAFDARGWAYFTGDEYDLFYPGYGDSWPSLLGAIGMTYEQAGSGAAGLAVRRTGGDTLTLRDRATHHLVSGLTTLQTAAAGKTALMLDFAAGQRSIDRSAEDFLLVPGPDSTRLAALVEHLRRQGITVERAAGSFRAAAAPHSGFQARRDFPAGTVRVPARQPRGRLAQTLLAPAIPLDAESSYDISAWSLPYAYGVEAHQARGGAQAVWEPLLAVEAPAPQAPPAAYGYLVPGTLEATGGIVRLMQGDARVRVLSRPATIAGREWPEGTWFLPVFGNPSLQARVDSVGLGALATPVETGLSDSGADLGSESVWGLRLPRVGLFSGERVAPSSFGGHWFFLERELGIDPDVLLVDELLALDLSRYDVLVIPDIPARSLEPAELERLAAWVERGGRLIAVAGGAAAVAGGFDVTARAVPGRDSIPPERLLRTRTERLRTERQEEVTGVILEVRVDHTHPLGWSAAGAADSTRFVLHNGSLVFDPSSSVETVAYFPGELDATSGVISEENLERLEHGAWLVTRSRGSGSVTLFADDPLFRLFWYHSQQPYTRAILIGPRD